MRKRVHKLFQIFLCLLLIVFILVGPYYLLNYRPHDVDYNKENEEPLRKIVSGYSDIIVSSTNSILPSFNLLMFSFFVFCILHPYLN